MSSSHPVQSLQDRSRSLPDDADRSCLVPGLFLLAWLVLAVPLFLRMPETNDAEMFDLQAWLISSGGVLYRDVLEPNLPGVTWIHMVVRAIAGSGTEVLRAFDLLSFAVLMLFVFRLLKLGGGTARSATWTVLGCSMFYLSTSEWCHCQRDMWMLTPVAVGICLRLKQCQRAVSGRSPGRLILWGLVEGLIWGSGIWIKPHVLLITIAVWLCVLNRSAGWRRTVLDAFGLLGGGLLAGAAGIFWLHAAGAWPHLLDTFVNWNPRYLDAGRENWTFDRFKLMAIRFCPWFLLHFVAVPVSLKQVWQRVVGSAEPGSAEPGDTESGHAESGGTVGLLVASVLSSVYLVWMLNAYLLQHLFDYVHAPAVVLAIIVCAERFTRSSGHVVFRSVAMLSGVAVVASSPVLKWETVSLWPECVVRTIPSVELQDRLAHFSNPRRTDLQVISDYLRAQKVEGTDVLVFNSDAVSLYRGLHLKPPTRAVYFFETLLFFPDSRDDVILKAMANRPRFIVLDLVSCLVMESAAAHEVGPDGIHAPPPAYVPHANDFPWEYPVVFRSGSWLILKVR